MGGAGTLTPRLRPSLTLVSPTGCHHGPAPHGRRHHCRSKAKRSRHHQTPRADAPCYGSHPPPVSPSAPWPPPPAAAPFPAMVQSYPLPVFSTRGSPQPLPSAPTAGPPAAFPAPLVTPMVALVLPNYLFPTPSSYPYGVAQTPAEGPPTPASHSPSPSLPPPPPSPSRRPDSPLFNSRCSSPLQLNLLQLEEPPRVEGGAVAGGPGNSAGPPPSGEEATEPEARLVSTDPLTTASSYQAPHSPPSPAPLPPRAPPPTPSPAHLAPQSPADGVTGWETPAEFLNEAETRHLICGAGTVPSV